MSFKTAAMMREITQENIMSGVENMLQETEACAKQGKTEYHIDDLLSLFQRQKLIELGYNVRTWHQYNESWTIISW